jgi:hypothetical protein
VKCVVNVILKGTSEDEPRCFSYREWKSANALQQRATSKRDKSLTNKDTHNFIRILKRSPRLATAREKSCMDSFVCSSLILIGEGLFSVAMHLEKRPVLSIARADSFIAQNTAESRGAVMG